MTIIVDGKVAVLKKGSSFDYTLENRLFMGRDGYTLSMSFPMKDCRNNRSIFGWINRADVEKKKLSYACEIRDGDVVLFGSLKVVGVSDSEVRCQFAEGRCEQTVTDPFKEVYVNELDLGEYPSGGYWSPAEAWENTEAVALPWINNAYPTQFNNWVEWADDKYVWKNAVSSSVSSRAGGGAHTPTSGGSEQSESLERIHASYLSWQPYLIVIAERICAAVGYSCSFEEWANSLYRHLLICNTLPYTWKMGYGEALPHWTVSEFFEKLELLLMGEFSFDHRARSVGFRFLKNSLSCIDPVKIDDVVDSYDVEVANDGSGCKYLGAKRLEYRECSHEMQPFYACDWFLESQQVRVYSSVVDIVNRNHRHMLIDSRGRSWPAYGEFAQILLENDYGAFIVNDVNKVLYAEAEDSYFVMRSIGVQQFPGYRPGGYVQRYALQMINAFGSGSVEADDVESEQIDFVPACIMDTYVDESDDMGDILRLSFGEFQADADIADESEVDEIRQPITTEAILSGEKTNTAEYYDAIYVGFWKPDLAFGVKTPHPVIDNVEVDSNWNITTCNMPSLRLANRLSELNAEVPKVKTRQKFKFSWLSKSLPNPRAVFFIKGKRYICEKITASFSDEGMSHLLKGEFYLIDE